MTTNLILESKDRELFGVTIKQETKTGFLSVSELQRAYEVARWQYGWSERHIKTIMQTTDFKERVFCLLEEQGLIKVGIPTFIEMCDKEGVTKVLKNLGVWKTTGARHTKTVMCDPYVWVLLAMELNPKIYGKVVIWLADKLIFNRLEAGNEYKPMNISIKSIVENPDYSKYAIAINERVFGKHITGMRNLASSQELKNITKIEQFITQGISIGMIKNEEQIVYAIKNFSL